jgi:hypothetical protein
MRRGAGNLKFLEHRFSPDDEPVIRRELERLLGR